MVVDWEKTKVVPRRTYIWVNLEGRDPEGIVSPDDYDKVRREVADVLTGVRDPETGESPIEAILTKENMRFYGQ